MTGYISKKMLGAARLPDTPSARKYLERVLDDDDTQVYKKPWVGLTDEEWMAMYDKFAKHQEYGAFISGWDKFAKAIDAVLKEKNT